MLGINCRFSNVSLDGFVTLVEGRHINACRVLQDGEEYLEAGYRAPEAPDVLQVARGEFFWSVQTLVSHVLVFALSYADATPILAHWGLTTKVWCN
jgi:uncharacterized damage-inducible protein DinB